MTRGTVLFHQKFKFSDGAEGQKLLIVLNTPKKSEDPFLVCKTTSKCKFLIAKEGCHSDRGIYHIKAKRDWFASDTWIELYEIFELSREELLKAHLQDKICKVMHKLKDQTLSAILNCIWKSDDVTQYQLDLLFSY